NTIFFEDWEIITVISEYKNYKHMNSDTRIPTIQFETLNAYTSSVVTNINTSPKHNEQRNSKLLIYSKQMQIDEDEDEFYTPVNIYREHKTHLEQDKRVRKELDTQMLDDLYEPIQKAFLRNSKILTSKDVDISSANNGIITAGMWNYNFNVLEEYFSTNRIKHLNLS
ncbi:20736_t:CDS:1, partial [Cetraspora pellucida]